MGMDPDHRSADLFDRYAAIVRLGRELVDEGPQGVEFWRRACVAVDVAPHALTIAPQSGRLAYGPWHEQDEDTDAPIARVRAARRMGRG
jgi:hypothetical protein